MCTIGCTLRGGGSRVGRCCLCVVVRGGGCRSFVRVVWVCVGVARRFACSVLLHWGTRGRACGIVCVCTCACVLLQPVSMCRAVAAARFFASVSARSFRTCSLCAFTWVSCTLRYPCLARQSRSALRRCSTRALFFFALVVVVALLIAYMESECI